MGNRNAVNVKLAVLSRAFVKSTVGSGQLTMAVVSWFEVQSIACDVGAAYSEVKYIVVIEFQNWVCNLNFQTVFGSNFPWLINEIRACTVTIHILESCIQALWVITCVYFHKRSIGGVKDLQDNCSLGKSRQVRHSLDYTECVSLSIGRTPGGIDFTWVCHFS